jgi:hypothetical protein
MEQWLGHENSTDTKHALLNLFCRARNHEDLALAISAMLIIWNNRRSITASAVISRLGALLKSFTPPGNIQVFFHQLAASFRLMLDRNYDRSISAPIVFWLLDVTVKQCYEAAGLMD